jgi:hypothetical protein
MCHDAVKIRALAADDHPLLREGIAALALLLAATSLAFAQTASGVIRGTVQTLNVTLQVGLLTESIGVRADRGLLDASDAGLSQVIDDKTLLAQPTNGRNVMQLVSLSAGVINAGRASATQRQANYGPSFSVGGLRKAFRQAHAGRVEVEIRYDQDEFRLRVRDNDRQIDAAVPANQVLRDTTACAACPNAPR